MISSQKVVHKVQPNCRNLFLFRLSSTFFLALFAAIDKQTIFIPFNKFCSSVLIVFFLAVVVCLKEQVHMINWIIQLPYY